MFTCLLVLAVLFQQSFSIVVRKSQDNNDQPVTLPTELFKPMNSEPSNSYEPHGAVFHSTNTHEGYGHGNEFETNRSVVHPLYSFEGHRSIDLSGNSYERQRVGMQSSRHSNQGEGRFEHENTFSEQYGRFTNYGQSSDENVPLSNMFPSPSAAFRDHMEMAGMTSNAGIQSQPNNGHYKIITHRNFYNSETMDSPITQHFEYDSRKNRPFNYV